MARGARLLLLAGLVGAPTDRAMADDPIVTKAASASTIAEIFVTEDSVRIEIEIGVRDLGAFRNLMPDELFERIVKAEEPFGDRIRRFFASDFVVRADGSALSGVVAEITARRRVARDEISGEPLPAKEGAGEVVVFAVLEFPLTSRPATLSFRPPMRDDGRSVRANIGFVLYHFALPVLDFRYLAGEETVELDWEDPWFSRFRNPNLRRRNAAPISAYLYLEHFEVRKEIVVRPKDLQRWVDLGLEGKKIIRVADQPELMRRVAAFLAGRNPVVIDGRSVEPELDRIHFLKRSLRQTGIVDPPEDLDVTSATLGVIYVYPVDGLPQEVAMTWELFSPRFPAVPASATDDAGGLPALLTAEDPVLRWQNFLTDTSPPTMLAVDIPSVPARLVVPVLSMLCGALAVMLWAGCVRHARRGRRPPLGLAGAGAVAVVLAFVFAPHVHIDIPLPFAARTEVAREQVDPVIGALLHNVYRAFDRRGESAVYDALERSVTGDLLTDIYLETRRCLEIENQGGARARVDEVELVEVTDYSTGTGESVGFRARCVWIAGGSVGHWGHIHRRRNRYDALLSVRSVDGTFKISGLELLEEQRL